MTADWDRVKQVFQAALDTPPEKRAAFVREACGADHDLRTEVDSLLLAHERAGSFAEQPALEVWADAATHGGEAVDRQLQPGDQLEVRESMQSPRRKMVVYGVIIVAIVLMMAVPIWLSTRPVVLAP
jgi:hypothetical protein